MTTTNHKMAVYEYGGILTARSSNHRPHGTGEFQISKLIPLPPLLPVSLRIPERSSKKWKVPNNGSYRLGTILRSEAHTYIHISTGNRVHPLHVLPRFCFRTTARVLYYIMQCTSEKHRVLPWPSLPTSHMLYLGCKDPIYRVLPLTRGRGRGGGGLKNINCIRAPQASNLP